MHTYIPPVLYLFIDACMHPNRSTHACACLHTHIHIPQLACVYLYVYVCTCCSHKPYTNILRYIPTYVCIHAYHTSS